MTTKRKRGRPAGPKTRNGNRWTESQFRDFIVRQLRSASRKWGPLNDTKKEANLRRGVYLCNGCKKEVPPTIKNGRKRVQNIFVDHIKPIVDPSVGFTNYEDFVEGLFCERDNLQLLCGECHDRKTAEERAIAIERRAKERGDNLD